MIKKIYKATIFGITLSGSVLLSQISHGSGFAIIEHSASGLGQAFAGAAAVAEDPSTIYFNPAGMTYLKGTQATAGMHIIRPKANFNNKNSSASLMGGAVPVAVGNDDGGDAGKYNFVPNFYYMREFGNNYRFGLGINSPVGLNTTYDDDWMGRYTSTESDLKTININPSLAFKASDKLSMGLGFSVQYIEATLVSQTFLCGHPQLAPTCNPTSAAQVRATDAEKKLNGDGWSVGYNLGLIYQINDATRLGIAYRSKVHQTLEGTVKVSTPNGFKLLDSKVDGDIELPATFSVSLAHNLSDKATLLADITHTSWSSFHELRINLEDGSADITEEKWSDSLRYSLGLKYQYSDKLILRTGIAYDETPIDNDYRTSRIPGDNRTWLAFGASYDVSKQLTIDAGYTHLWVSDAKISEDYSLLNGAGSGTLDGEYKASVDIVSIQGTWKF